MSITKTYYNGLTDGLHEWIVSGSGTNEYYLRAIGGGVPASTLRPFVEPVAVTGLVAGTLSSLAADEFAWGDADTLGFDTIYVRLTSGADPDTLATDALVATVQTALTAKAIIGAEASMVETVTKVTLVAGVVKLALELPVAPRKVEIWDEDTGADLWHAFATSAPTVAAMKKIPAGVALTYEDNERIAGNLYLLSVGGGDVKVVRGD